MPALLKTTSSRPKLFSAKAIIASASFAFEISAPNARAFPPISFAVASAVSFFKSTTTTFAPSLAKRRQEALPIPLPPPVIRATLFASRMSGHFEIAAPLPIGDHRVEFSLFRPEEVQVMIDDRFAERGPGPLALRQRVNRFVQRVRHLRKIACCVDVAFE